jgi:heme/copper-type cytochrome/quinol oxidase subunit 4
MRILLSPVSAVWMLLMLATCASTWWLSKDGIAPTTVTVLILAIAAIKVRLIMINFMELGHAPVRWRLLFDAWTVACTAVILIMYLH